MLDWWQPAFAVVPAARCYAWHELRAPPVPPPCAPTLPCCPSVSCYHSDEITDTFTELCSLILTEHRRRPRLAAMFVSVSKIVRSLVNDTSTRQSSLVLLTSRSARPPSSRVVSNVAIRCFAFHPFGFPVYCFILCFVFLSQSKSAHFIVVIPLS